MFLSHSYVVPRMLMAYRGYLYDPAMLYIGIFRIEYAACACDVYDAMENLCIHVLDC